MRYYIETKYTLDIRKQYKKKRKKKYKNYELDTVHLMMMIVFVTNSGKKLKQKIIQLNHFCAF